MTDAAALLAALDAQQFARFTQETWADLARFGPESVLALGTAALVLGSAFTGREASRRLGWAALGVVLAALFLVTRRFGAAPAGAFSGMIRLDPMADFFGGVFLAGTAVAICLVMLSRDLAARPHGEAHASLLCGALGMMLMAEATDLARRFAAKVKGVTMNLATETLLGVPSTAHILGGCCMGDRAGSGVIDAQHRVFGYDGLYVIDGSAMSANPGVNPSLTITALAERAMGFIPPKSA